MKKNNIFKSVPVRKVNRNLFDLSHSVKMSGKFGFLYPCLVADTLPGETWRDEMVAFLRFAPMLAPILHDVDVTSHFFFVPNRLLWDDWEDFITGGQDGLNTSVPPYFNANTLIAEDAQLDMCRKGTLWDYLGLPVLDGAAPGAGSQSISISALPFRAVAKVWNDFYRDPNFDTEKELNTELGGEVAAESYAAGLFDLEARGWEKDYLTACLPWSQRGAQVLLPLSATGDVIYQQPNLWATAGGGMPGAGDTKFDGATGNLRTAAGTIVNVQNIDYVQISNSEVYINDFRRAIAIQGWLETNAIGGGRYTESVKSHFNEQVPDFRLQRAEYIGGGRQPVQISEVLSTADTVDVPVGDMAGKGTSVGRSNRFTYRCKEHGWVLCFLSVMPKPSYQQGIERMFFRVDKFEYAWPELANLGEQQVFGAEAMYHFDSASDGLNNGIFGYIPRYSEYKFKNDRVAGDFRDNLSFWALTRIFTSHPALDSSFTTMHEHNTAEEETYRRIFAVQDGTDYLWMQLNHHLTVKRPLPYYGVPSIL